MWKSSVANHCYQANPFTLAQALPSDAGSYTLTVSNEFGSDTSTVEVSVSSDKCITPCTQRAYILPSSINVCNPSCEVSGQDCVSQSMGVAARCRVFSFVTQAFASVKAVSSWQHLTLLHAKVIPESSVLEENVSRKVKQPSSISGDLTLDCSHLTK